MNISQSWPCIPVLLTALGGLAIVVRSMVLLLGFLITVRRMTRKDRLVAFKEFAQAAGSARSTSPGLPTPVQAGAIASGTAEACLASNPCGGARECRTACPGLAYDVAAEAILPASDLEASQVRYQAHLLPTGNRGPSKCPLYSGPRRAWDGRLIQPGDLRRAALAPSVVLGRAHPARSKPWPVVLCTGGGERSRTRLTIADIEFCRTADRKES